MLDGSGFQLGIAVLARELGYLDGRRVAAPPGRRRPRRRLLHRVLSAAVGLLARARLRADPAPR
jgi:hypothetical protein